MPASPDGWLSRTLAGQLDAHELDVPAAVAATMAMIPPDGMLDVLETALTVCARQQVTRMRSARFRSAYRELTRPAAGEVFRIPINAGGVKRTIWLGDATRTDLITAAERLERLAHADLARAGAYRRLADAMEMAGAGCVAELEERTVRDALQVDVEHPVAEEVA